MKQLYFLLALFCFSGTNFGQSVESNYVAPNSLDYYLLQSFHVADSQQRIALNHIGIQGRFQDSQFLVTAVLEGYPAHAAGIERGDVILTVDERPFHPVNSFNLERNREGSFIPVTSEHTLRVQRGSNTTEIMF